MIYNEHGRMIWFADPCLIAGDRILIEESGQAREYNPFDYYRDNQDSLYLQFALLKTEEDIERFITSYGFLGIETNKTWQDMCLSSSNRPKSESLTRFKQEVLRMNNAVRLWEVVTKYPHEEDGDFSVLENGIKVFYDLHKEEFDRPYFEVDRRSGQIQKHPFPIMLITQDIESYSSGCQIAHEAIAYELRHQLKNVTPSIYCSEDVPEYMGEWKAPNLLTALWVMLYMDLLKGRQLRKCRNKTCPNYFPIYGNDQRKIYCNDVCGQNERQRRYRRNKSKEKKHS